MKKKKLLYSFLILAVICLALSFLVKAPQGHEESIKIAMKDAVLHEVNKINFFGLMEVNPAIISAFVVTGVIFVLSLIISFVLLPKFTYVPGKLQLMIESSVLAFNNMAKSNSPHKNVFLGRYIFTAGTYIFIGTLFELLGIQALTTSGASIAIPAPLSDINAAIAMGFLSYIVILIGGLSVNGAKGVLGALKDFSLPISMSFRLFGALLSGLLVTELVYYFVSLRFVLPVIVAVLFTLLHALIQAYVLTMLTSLFYGEATE
ncbi:MAG: F0F1 ATP synthase subunit A [Tissierellia bacterium]|nr:F0F1 ATP synthase subunit A [Tissierellia bacterium]